MNAKAIIKSSLGDTTWYANLRRNDLDNSNKVLTVLFEKEVSWGSFNKLYKSLEDLTGFSVLLCQVEANTLETLNRLSNSFHLRDVYETVMTEDFYLGIEECILKTSEEEDVVEVYTDDIPKDDHRSLVDLDEALKNGLI